MTSETDLRMDAEWVGLSAFRDLVKIASNNDKTKSTYKNALRFGGALYPELLGDETSILRRDYESDVTREYRQKAILMSKREGRIVSPLDLVLEDIKLYDELIFLSENNKSDKEKTDQLKKRLVHFIIAKNEIDVSPHSENELIFRDAYSVDRSLPSAQNGQSYRDFYLTNNRILRVRVLHPNKSEQIVGADIVYERHNPLEKTLNLACIQYKIWENRKLYFSDDRLHKQIERMRGFLCNRGICAQSDDESSYRFPYCSAFLRPTDKIQKTDQKFLSTGEHLPICKIYTCKTKGILGAETLEYEAIKDVSLNGDLFDELFNKGRIGSRKITYLELEKLYSDGLIQPSTDTMIIYAQEFAIESQSQPEFMR
jgi:hypothetical protein